MTMAITSDVAFADFRKDRLSDADSRDNIASYLQRNPGLILCLK
jgi:hypothetical protein